MINYFTFKNENKTWIEITREERFFCSELYHDIKKDISAFIKFLNENRIVKLDADSYWEIGYEVCFYRDYIKANGGSIKKFNNENLKNNPDAVVYPPKRTFDLCLFSNEKIVIIEAKADQKFKKPQLEYLKKDIEDFLPNILNDYNPDIKVEAILLCSSCNPKNEEGFNWKKIYWNQLAKFYENEIYRRADMLGKKNSKQ